MVEKRGRKSRAESEKLIVSIGNYYVYGYGRTGIVVRKKYISKDTGETKFKFISYPVDVSHALNVIYKEYFSRKVKKNTRAKKTIKVSLGDLNNFLSEIQRLQKTFLTKLRKYDASETKINEGSNKEKSTTRSKRKKKGKSEKK